MAVTQTMTFTATPPVIGDVPEVFEGRAIGVWNELKLTTVPNLNTAFTQMNALETNVNAKEVLADNYANLLNATVETGKYSAKEFAVGDLTATGGSAKAWASDTASPDGTTSKSAKTLSGEAVVSASAALASQNSASSSASSATASASSASSSATTASTGATTATAKALEAATSASNALASELAATAIVTAPLVGAIGNINSPLLDMPLKNSLAMKSGVGSATFTRASTATYIDRYGVLKTSAIDEPRFEKEYLNEGASTNLQLYSNGMSTGYSVSRGTLSFNTINTLDPFGTNLATEFLETTTAGGTYIYQSTTFTAGVTYTQSIFVKSINGQNAQLSGFVTTTGFSTNNIATFDLLNGAILSDNSGTAKIQALSNGWYRISITATCTTTTTANYTFLTMLTDYFSTSYGLYIFGAQLE